MMTGDADEAAIQWFVRLQDCEDERLWEEHFAWLQSDPAHAAAYARVERLWIAADDLRRRLPWPATVPPFCPCPMHGRRAIDPGDGGSRC